MPNPVTQEQTVKAINEALAEMKPPGEEIDNLNTNALSNPMWSCNNFSPTVLEKVCKITNTCDNLKTENYAQGDKLPEAFTDKTFINISMIGKPSDLNHNFNILVSGETTYLIQAFLDKAVNIVLCFTNRDFITHWCNLSNNTEWMESYNKLFGISPSEVVKIPLTKTWLDNQYVT